MEHWIPTWKDRLRACFQWRHRALHVLGAPLAAGMVTSAVSADLLNAGAGLGLGGLVAGVGAVLAGYYVVSGFDRGLVDALQKERAEGQLETRRSAITSIVSSAPDELRPIAERVVANYDAIEQYFTDGISDQVEAVLQTSLGDLEALRDRAVSLVGLHNQLSGILRQVDVYALNSELQRTTSQLQASPPGQASEALLAAQESTQKAIAKYQAAQQKQQQVRNVMTVIDTSLQEFKLAMELRKADATLSSDSGAPDVSELQLRLEAAGQACDELVGGTRRARQRARA